VHGGWLQGERAEGSVRVGPGGLQGARRKGGGTTHGGLQGLGDGASGGGDGRCRNARRKACCRGMAAAVQR
jgi:hypothetical protein